mgnify:CR=1 FL=1
MNEQKIVSDMIDFVEEKEKLLQQSKLLADQKAKNDTINAILDKLEKETYENQ